MRVIDVLNSPWAITPTKLSEICEIYSTHLRGEKIDIAGVEARVGDSFGRKDQGYEIVNGVAIIPIDGVIAKKMNLFSRISGGASTQMIKRDVEDALNDEEVNSIILEIDSPGGTVDGTSELASYIHESRGTKPIYALADGCMCSAAYWIGSAADKVYITSDTTQVGSIGVVSTHVDYSAQEANKGIKTTEITSGKYKRIASPHEPLSQEGREYIQSSSDYLYSLFVDGVARNRNVSTDEVLENMADGRVFIGQLSIDAGLVDGVSTLDQLIASLSSGKSPSVQTIKAGAADDVSGLSSNDKIEEVNSDMEPTIESIESDHPEIAKHFSDLGFAQGAKSERERIKEVREQTMPGHEALVETLMFDGKTTGPEAAVQVLNAERSSKQKVTANIRDDAAEVATVPAAQEPEVSSKKSEDLPFEEQAKAEWDANASVRDEFNGDFDSYLAFEKAQTGGRVKVLGGKK